MNKRKLGFIGNEINQDRDCHLNFIPQTISSSVEGSQAFHPSFMANHFDQLANYHDQTKLCFTDPFCLDRNGQDEQKGQLSPKHFVQMGELYSLPGDSSTFHPNDYWGTEPHVSTLAEPSPNAGLNLNGGIQTTMSLPFRDSGYESKDIPEEMVHFGGNAGFVPIAKEDRSLKQWQHERYVH